MGANKHRAIAWLSVLLLMLPGLAFAAKGRLIGKVVDPKGSPIPGVRVTTTCAEIPAFREIATTNDKGVFMVDFQRINVVYLYQFEKAGQVTLKIEQRWTIEDTERHQFTMSPAETATIAAAAPGPAPASTSAPAILAFNAGVLAFKSKDYPTALAKFQEATEQDPNLRQAWIALSAIDLEQQRYQQAAETAEKAIALGSTDESVLKSRWLAYHRLGDEAKAALARADLERLGRLSEEAKRVYNEGVRLSKGADEEAAFARFREALALDPNCEPALLGLAASALKLDRAAEAAAAAETLLKGNAQHAEALKIRYNAALKLKDEAKLADALLGLAAVDAATARNGLFALASGAFHRDDFAAAKENLRRVLGIDPIHAQSHYLLGLILMREGAKAEAKSHLERFLQLAPDDPDAAMAKDALKYLR